MGPRKNLEYRPRRAVSRLAKARRDNRGVEEKPGVAFEFGVGVDAPEEAHVPTMGGRLDSIPVEVCLNSSVEERVSFACRKLVRSTDSWDNHEDSHRTVGHPRHRRWRNILFESRTLLQYTSWRDSILVLEMVGRDGQLGAY
jgi:hypothetical protein